MLLSSLSKSHIIANGMLMESQKAGVSHNHFISGVDNKGKYSLNKEESAVDLHILNQILMTSAPLRQP